MQIKPNFERLRSTLYCGQSDRISLIELLIDRKIKEAFLNKPIKSWKDEIEFWVKAGYDYIPLGKMPNWNPENKDWNIEGRGIITTMEEFEKHTWPTPNEVDYSDIEEVSRLLPDGMKIIVRTGGFFSFVWRLMGFNSFFWLCKIVPNL